MKSLEEYLCHLEGKGFQLEEDSIGFIYFGKHYTNAPDELVNTAIEMTLKAQKIDLLTCLLKIQSQKNEQAFASPLVHFLCFKSIYANWFSYS